MTYSLLFYVIIAIIGLNYCLEQWLEWLNAKNRSATLPEELVGIYDDEKYSKSIEYDTVTGKFGFLTSTFNLLLTLIMLFLGGFALVDTWAGLVSLNPIWRALMFFGIIGFAADILNTPFGIYQTFVIEQRFGFNKTTAKTYIFDKLKGWILSGLIGGILLVVILWFYYKTTDMFWIYAWLLTSVVMIFFAMFYSNLIVPLFNKQEPLEDGELKSAIQQFASNTGFKLDNIYKIDGSKRSTKANAYFTGLGSKKRIVLYDTLIKELTVSEIVAVLAHEIGHYKRKHTRQSLVLSVLQMGLMFFLISLFIRIPALSMALGVAQPSFHTGLIAFGILYSPFSTLIGLIMNMLSRKNEYEADAFTSKNFESESLIGALKNLSVNNLSNLTPHPFYVFFHYSHPTLLQRIKALRKV